MRENRAISAIKGEFITVYHLGHHRGMIGSMLFSGRRGFNAHRVLRLPHPVPKHKNISTQF